jgi:hypothetical protein
MRFAALWLDRVALHLGEIKVARKVALRVREDEAACILLHVRSLSRRRRFRGHQELREGVCD